MFENDKNVEKLEDGKYNFFYPLETDEDGYLDKECPSEECLFKFKVFADDWNEKTDKNSVFCPQCRYNASYDSFWTTEQLENAKEQAEKQVMNQVSNMFSDMAKKFNRNQSKNSFISMKMEVSSNHKKYVPLAIIAEKEFQQKIKCLKCDFRYSVIGTAFFCPSCGHNSISEVFDKSIQKVENNLKLIKINFTEKSDETENFITSYLENSLVNLVGNFESFCKKIYTDNFDKNSKVNFQDLKKANKVWKKVFGESYKNWLTDFEYNELNVLFQKRHLLSHSNGIVGEKYINRVENTKYKLGQRIVIKEDNIIRIIYLIKIIVNKIREYLAKGKDSNKPN